MKKRTKTIESKGVFLLTPSIALHSVKRRMLWPSLSGGDIIRDDILLCFFMVAKKNRMVGPVHTLRTIDALEPTSN